MASEDLPPVFRDFEEKAGLDLNAGSMRIEFTYPHARIVTFLGRQALNCIVIDGTDESGKAIQVYLFAISQAYHSIEAYLREHDFPQMLNLPTVPGVVVDEYVKCYGADDIDSLLNGWRDG